MKKIIFLIYSLFVNINIFSQDIPISGDEVEELKSFDESVIAFMKKWKIPGGQLAVCKDGRLIYSRSFGYGDLNNTEPVTTTNLFRIASVSKPITAVAIMKLVEEKKISLDDKAFLILNDLTPLPGKSVDPRLYDVTIRMLLEHAGGWSTNKVDRQTQNIRIAADAFGVPRPADKRTIIRYGIGDMLDFTPGTEYSYSNFGYNILGRIIEKVTGKTYEKYLQEDILKTAGINDMQIGKTKFKDRLPNEVMYKDEPEAVPGWSVFDDELQMVTRPYGSIFCLETGDAPGGWLSNAEDLVKFITSVDTKTKRPHILNDETVQLMLGEPLVKSLIPDWYYAKGWNYNSKEDSWQDAGATFGNSASITRFGNGISLAVVFNYMPMMQTEEYFREMYEKMIPDAIKGVTKWPDFNKWDEK